MAWIHVGDQKLINSAHIISVELVNGYPEDTDQSGVVCVVYAQVAHPEREERITLGEFPGNDRKAVRDKGEMFYERVMQLLAADETFDAVRLGMNVHSDYKKRESR